jgi:hypothetical protein
VSFTRTGVQFLRNSIALSLSKILHAGSFRDVLANQSVGIFVGTSLPGVMRICEVKASVCRGLDFRILMKLGAVIRGDRFERSGLTVQQLDATPIE